MLMLAYYIWLDYWTNIKTPSQNRCKYTGNESIISSFHMHFKHFYIILNIPLCKFDYSVGIFFLSNKPYCGFFKS